MTRTELEQIARQVRAKGLHSTWNDLLEFTDCVVANMVDSYQALLRNTTSDTFSTSETSNLCTMVQDKLARALTAIAGKSQVAIWESEVGSELSTGQCDKE